MQFTKKEFQAFREDFVKALQPVADKFALAIEAGAISYQENTFSMKVTCSKTDAGDIKRDSFTRCCSIYGFTGEDYLRVFTYKGIEYVLEELSPGSPKYPCLCLNTENNQRYKMTVEIVKNALGR